MHKGAFAPANKGGRKRRGGSDIAKLSVGAGGVLHPRAATDHEQYLSGHGGLCLLLPPLRVLHEIACTDGFHERTVRSQLVSVTGNPESPPS
jgi:hypothetical protein